MKDKTVVVIGMGRSGAAAAELLLSLGARVRGTDMNTSIQGAPDGVELTLGTHPEELLKGADLVVVSPGVPATSPFLASAQKRGIQIIGELELGWWHRPKETKTIAITGSNGKSTTVTLTAHLLNAGGVDTWAGGNLGTPLSRLCVSGATPAAAVIEVSSFQLEWAPSFSPDIAAILNVSPNHLDRHADLAEYAGLKGRIFTQQAREAYSVYNRDDDFSRNMAAKAPGIPFSFGGSLLLDDGSKFDDESIEIKLAGRTGRYSLANFPAPGAHNRANAAAALLMARLAGADPSALASALGTFEPLPHRLERIAEARGVTFYNDSKATTVEALARSLSCFSEPIVLIVGGRDKGGDFATLTETIRRKVKQVVLIGEATETIAGAWNGATPTVKASSLDEAFQAAVGASKSGDVVLFSPACASFDMFENFEKRGEAFAALAKDLE